MNGKLFVLEANSVSSNDVLSLNRTELNMFFPLFRYYKCRDLDDATEGIPRRRVFSSQILVVVYKQQIKIDLLSERQRLFSL